LHTSIKEVVQSMIPSAPGIMLGRVINEDPIKIQIVNDNYFVLDSNKLLISDHLKDYDLQIEMHNTQVTGATSSDNEHSHNISDFEMTEGTIKIKNSLKKGDFVYILPPYDSNNIYFVISRAD